MKKILLSIIVIVSFFFFAQETLAQTPPVSPSTPVQISYPIAELGNCASATSCKTYCDDPVNLQACIAYAKQKGFYRTSTLDSQASAILADAKTTLGCDSIDSCKTFCADVSHADACTAFAQKHNLAGGKKSPDNVTLDKAKVVLGCDSVDSCKAVCALEENKAKCASFAKENGLRGGDEKVGPGGCTSETSCKAFCSDPNNFQTCSRFSEDRQGSASGQESFKGPGGCTSEASCREFCDKNPIACHRPPVSGTPQITGGGLPEHIDTRACAEHPEECITGVPNGRSVNMPPPIVPRQLETQPTPNYELYCQSKGCSFNGTTCVCPSPQPTKSQDSSESTTEFSAPTVRPPFPTQSVQGASTHISFFQWFVNELLHLK